MPDTGKRNAVFEAVKKYEELNFTDDFMFCKILTHNLGLCRELLEIILEKKISRVELPQAQKDIKITYDGKGIRLDVYVEDFDHTVYDIEMQMAGMKNLPKRSRYYQGMIDLNLLNKGEDYKRLRKSYIIFICKFDLFQAGLCRYTFENVCLERPDIRLGDEASRVFINPYGRMEGMSEELRAFLKFLCGEDGTDEFTRALSMEVDRARKQEEWKVEYMTLQMRDQENIERGIERGRVQGREEGIKALINILLELGIEKETILYQLCGKFDLTSEEAEAYYSDYSKV